MILEYVDKNNKIIFTDKKVLYHCKVAEDISAWWKDWRKKNEKKWKVGCKDIIKVKNNFKIHMTFNKN